VFESARLIAHVAADLGLPPETLRKRVRQAEVVVGAAFVVVEEQQVGADAESECDPPEGVESRLRRGRDRRFASASDSAVLLAQLRCQYEAADAWDETRYGAPAPRRDNRFLACAYIDRYRGRLVGARPLPTTAPMRFGRI
jgi:hypothetical protein